MPPVLRYFQYFQWNRAVAIRCRGWSRGAHAPRVRRLTPRQPRPRAPPRVDPAWPGTRDFGMSPANRRRAGFPRAVVFQKRMRTWLRPASHWLPPLRPQYATAYSEEPCPPHPFSPNPGAGNEIEKSCREPGAVGRVTPCAPRLQRAGAVFPRRRRSAAAQDLSPVSRPNF